MKSTEFTEYGGMGAMYGFNDTAAILDLGIFMWL